MALSWPPKDPDEVLDYVIDWSLRLDSDIISSSTWSVTEGTGLTIDADTYADTTATVWLSGGTDGERYTLNNRIVTVAGRTMDQSVKIRIKPR